MRHAFGIPAMTKSCFGINQRCKVLTPDRRYANSRAPDFDIGSHVLNSIQLSGRTGQPLTPLEVSYISTNGGISGDRYMYDNIQLMHSFEVNIRICQTENSDVHRGEAKVNITFEG